MKFWNSLNYYFWKKQTKKKHPDALYEWQFWGQNVLNSHENKVNANNINGSKTHLIFCMQNTTSPFWFWGEMWLKQVFRGTHPLTQIRALKSSSIWKLTACPVTSNDRDRLLRLRPSKSCSRGAGFLTAWRFRGRVHVPLGAGPSPVLLDRLSSEVAWRSSGLGCLPRRSTGPLGDASDRDRLLLCFLGSRGEGGGGNRRASISRTLERRRAALTAMLCTPLRICCLSGGKWFRDFNAMTE